VPTMVYGPSSARREREWKERDDEDWFAIMERLRDRHGN